jgi:hypothetical protein
MTDHSAASSGELLDEFVAAHEGSRLQPGMHPELPEHVLDMGPSGLRADHEGLGDGIVVPALR